MGGWHPSRPPGKPKADVSRQDLSRETLGKWVHHEIISENIIRIHFHSGNKSCNGHRFVMNETDEFIEIALINGWPPEYNGICTMEARCGFFDVETKMPIGNREIVEMRRDSVKLNRDPL